jgi:fibro-slime domain-containing protein
MPTQKPAVQRSRKRAKKRSATRIVPVLERLEDRLTPAPASITLDTTIRDFQPSHPDFEHGGPIGVVPGIVQNQLGADGKPHFAGSNGKGGVSSASSFNQWYQDVPGVNLTTTYHMPLNETSPGSGLYQFQSSAFFPIDNQLYGNSGQHNFHFTLELHTQFTYRSGDTFDFSADDDLWVFVNGQLVVDLGGLHGDSPSSLELSTLGLTPGQDCSFDLFYAERHTTQAALTLTLSRGPVASYLVTPPASTFNGDSFALQVQPVDQFGNPFPTGPGVVTFTSSDPNATLPASFDFASASPDANGFYTIPGFILVSPGTQTINLAMQGNPAVPGETATTVLNPPPSDLSVLIAGPVKQGEPVQLTGSFGDSGLEQHTIIIDWGDGTQEAFVLPAGDDQFTASHAYADGLPGGNPAHPFIQVIVQDTLGGQTSASTFAEVNNVPPSLAVSNADEFANQFRPFVRAGQVSDPGGLSETTVEVTYGDSTVIHMVTVQPDGSFRLANTYKEEGSFLVTVTASDNRGGVDRIQFTVDVLLAGVPLDPADKEFASPGETVMAEAQLGANKGTVVFTHSAEARRDAAIIVAVVPAPVAAGLTRSFIIDGKVISSAFDVRALGAYLLDDATVIFRYVSRSDRPPTLTYFNTQTHRQEPVDSDLYEVDVAKRTITIRLTRDTIPSLLQLTGTVFTISVPIAVSPTPPGDSSPVTAVVLGVLQGRQRETISGQAVNLLGRGEGIRLATGSQGQGETGIASATLGINGGGAPNSEGTAGGVGASLVAESGPLKDLPKVHGSVIDLPSVNLVPPGSNLMPATSSGKNDATSQPEEETGAPAEGENAQEVLSPSTTDADEMLLSPEALSDALFADPPAEGWGWGGARKRDAVLMAALALAGTSATAKRGTWKKERKSGTRKKGRSKRSVPGLCS